MIDHYCGKIKLEKIESGACKVSYHTFVAECLIRPSANGTDGFRCSNSIVSYEHFLDCVVTSSEGDKLSNIFEEP